MISDQDSTDSEEGIRFKTTSTRIHQIGSSSASSSNNRRNDESSTSRHDSRRPERNRSRDRVNNRSNNDDRNRKSDRRSPVSYNRSDKYRRSRSKSDDRYRKKSDDRSNRRSDRSFDQTDNRRSKSGGGSERDRKARDDSRDKKIKEEELEKARKIKEEEEELEKSKKLKEELERKIREEAELENERKKIKEELELRRSKSGSSDLNSPTKNKKVKHKKHKRSKDDEQSSSPKIIKENTPKKSDGDFDLFGPPLPPHLANKKETDEIAVGPALPPHLLKSKSEISETSSNNHKKVIGPTLPANFESFESFNSETNLEPISDEEDYDIVGPLPDGAPKNKTYYELEKRALELKLASLGGNEDDKKSGREEWMVELPQVKKVANLGLTARQFRAKAGPDMSDRFVIFGSFRKINTFFFLQILEPVGLIHLMRNIGKTIMECQARKYRKL